MRNSFSKDKEESVSVPLKHHLRDSKIRVLNGDFGTFLPGSPKIHNRDRYRKVRIKFILWYSKFMAFWTWRKVALMAVILFAIIYFINSEIDHHRHLWDDSDPSIKIISEDDFNKYPEKVTNSLIPKIIHQTWKDENIPDHWKWDQIHCREIMPEYEFKLWTDASTREFLEEHYPWFLDTYDSYPYSIQRVDAARYFFLYHYGGIYMDLDVGCRQKFDNMLQYSVVLPRTYPLGFSNDVLFSEKHHPYFWQLMTRLSSYAMRYGTKYVTVMFSTGPMFVSLEFGNFPHRGSEIRVMHGTLYSNSTGSLFYHRDGNTWHDWDTEYIQWAGSHIPEVTFYITAIVLSLIGMCVGVRFLYVKNYTRLEKWMTHRRTKST